MSEKLTELLVDLTQEILVSKVGLILHRELLITAQASQDKHVMMAEDLRLTRPVMQ